MDYEENVTDGGGRSFLSPSSPLAVFTFRRTFQDYRVYKVYSDLAKVNLLVIQLVCKTGDSIMLKKCTLVLLIFVVVITSLTAIASEMKPIKYKCDDGRKFTITFVRDKGVPTTAKLIFSNSSKVEILENQMAASGICYANDKYEYAAHQGNVSFIDSTGSSKNNKFSEISCHEIK